MLRDDIVVVKNPAKRATYPARLRRITARIEINGVNTEMTFLSSNLEWAATSICRLYLAR